MGKDHVYKLNIDGRTLSVNIGDVIQFQGEFYVFRGRFEKKRDVPIERCVFIMGDRIIRRNWDDKRIEYEIKKRKDNVPKNTRNVDSEKIDVRIKTGDNELMVNIKEILDANSVTVDDFREFFKNDKVSDMNNMKRAIEQGNSLSWNKFLYMLEKMDYEYILSCRPKKMN